MLQIELRIEEEEIRSRVRTALVIEYGATFLEDKRNSTFIIFDPTPGLLEDLERLGVTISSGQ